MTVQEKENETVRASLELLYHISRELVGALDLPMVLQRVLQLSMENVGAISGSIIVLDDQGRPVDSAMRVHDRPHSEITEQLRATYERGLAGWVAQNRQVVLVPDTSRDERWLRRPDDARERTGPKSAIGVPILVREDLVGVMTLVHPQINFFHSEHQLLVQAIADQAGIAILNARLYAESKRQARAMTAIAESAGVITASLRLEDVLYRILEQVTQALRVELVTLALLTPGGEMLEYQACTGPQANSLVGLRVPSTDGIAGWVVRNGQGAVVGDVSADLRFDPQLNRRLGFTVCSVICAPIRSRGQVIGALEAFNPLETAFTQDALTVLSGIGSLAGTAIRHAQLFERLQAAHQRYRELFEDSIDPILITNWDGTIIEANRQAEVTLGYSKEALRLLRIGDVHEVDTNRLGGNFDKLRSGETITYESRLTGQGGHQVPIQVHARRVHIDGVAHWQWIFRDITERKNLDRLRQDLISMIYHDLRSPLANVVSSLDVLASMLTAEEQVSLASLLNIAVRSTERIQRLTDALLDMNSLEAGQPVGNRQPVVVSDLARESAEAVEPISLNKGVALVVEVPVERLLVNVDGDMIRRVLINLIENAVKFTPSGAKITVGSRQDGEWMRIWVQDEGPGIPPADRERIFDKFMRLQNNKGNYRGFGLGLAYCRLAVEGHGGKIWVESELDQGARFIFTLPVYKEGQQSLPVQKPGKVVE